MVWRIIQHIRSRQPPVAIGHAERNVAASPQASLDLLEELGWLGLMFQHFKKCHHVEFLLCISFRKFRAWPPVHRRSLVIRWSFEVSNRSLPPVPYAEAEFADELVCACFLLDPFNNLFRT
jgi:hypothetical protein